MITQYSISLTEAARWYQNHFGGDLPVGERWLWIEGIQDNGDLPDSGYFIAGETGLEGISKDDQGGQSR